MTTPARPPRPNWPKDCPDPPAAIAELPFRRRPMVDWLAPKQLASTGVRAVLGTVFGAYADKREVQAALDPERVRGRIYDAVYSFEPGADEFWLDYCADLGDGFDPTYAVAWTLSRPELAVPGVEQPLPRGRVLVLGGDQVYPTANRTEYRDRFAGPFQAAFPWGPENRAPDLYALPGNHDWYDGLTSFLRLFCQERWIGGWQTQQRRSYFALRLPGDWWLWGTDIQLESELDEPQIRFFRQVAKKMQQEAKSSGGAPRLILCTAQPEWVYCDADDARSRNPPRRGCRLEVSPHRFANLEFLRRETMRPFGVRLVAMISGDLHHFTYYAPVPGALEGPKDERPCAEHLVTCGGGGAYLYPTHHMPERLAVPEHGAAADAAAPSRCTHELAAVYPPEADSRRLGHRSWWRLPWRNLRFAALLGGVYLVYAWVLQSVSKSANLFAPGGASPGSLVERLADLEGLDPLGSLDAFADVLRHSPSAVVFGLLLVVGLWSFRRSAGRTRWRGATGAVHGLAHLALCFGLIRLLAWFDLEVLDWGVDDWHQALLFATGMLVAGGVLGGWLFGAYLALASRLSGAHTNEVFSAQSLTGFKSFLRMRIGRDGALSIYPVGIPEVPRGDDWKYRGGDPAFAPGDAWFEPPDGKIDVEPIGKPIEIS